MDFVKTLKASVALIVLTFCHGVFAYDIPENNRMEYNLNYDWKFIKSNPANAQETNFNDDDWSSISLPHTYNDIDLFDVFITGSGNFGWSGKTWYRKHFKLDASSIGKKVYVEFEGIRQAGEFYINGTWVGRHENGVGPAGIDISDYVHFGDQKNILAVRVDNSLGYREVESGANFEWNTPPFLPNYGGIVSNVKLHIVDPVHQSLPLYSSLGTSGVYTYATDIDLIQKTATIGAEAEVINNSGEDKTIQYDVYVVDANGIQVLHIDGGSQNVSAGEKSLFSASQVLTNAEFWSPDYPYSYRVYTQLSFDGNILDVLENPLGIRVVEFSAEKGLTINDQFLYLDGYAPRSTMEWVGVGKAPTWLEEYDFDLMKKSNANFLRPMHVAPRKMDIIAADKFGIVVACPAGDAESDSSGRHWEQRVELMRDVIIYYRNNPSIIFWEGGNQHLSIEHMQEMVAIENTWDRFGGRFSGTRSTLTELIPYAEYMSSMDIPVASATHPVWDAEWARAEAPRRVWDKYSPPYFGYSNIADPANLITEYPNLSFKYNSTEDLARDNIQRYNDRWSLRGDQGRDTVMVGGAKIIFADSVSHGRMIDTELARVTGVVDAARLPKQNYHALRVIQNEEMDVHILGHWNYLADTVKDIYVVSNADEVRLQLFDEENVLVSDFGAGIRNNHFEFTFEDVAWQPGSIRAIAFNNGVQVAQHGLTTRGDAASVKITSITGPQGFIADGSDIAMFDVEVVDADGFRVPTFEGVVSFSFSGEAQFIGGYNSGIENSIFRQSLTLENGINRVFVRSTRTPGLFTLNANVSGLSSDSESIASQYIDVTDGLSLSKPQSYAQTLKEKTIDAFFFADVFEADLGASYTSAPITLTGMTMAQVISIKQSNTLATFSVNGDGFSDVSRSVGNGDVLQVKIDSGVDEGVTTFARIDIGGVKDDFSVTTFKTDDPANETKVNLALLKPVQASNAQDVNPAVNINDNYVDSRWAGFGWPVSIDIDLGDKYSVANLELLPFNSRAYQFILEGSLDGETFFTLSDQQDNTTVQELLSIPFDAQSARYIKMTVTGAANYTGQWTSFYELRIFEEDSGDGEGPIDTADTIPDPFNITDVDDVEVFTEVISSGFVVTGIDAPTEILFSNASEAASYSINGGPFTSSPGTVVNEDVVRVQLSSGSQYDNTHFATLSIGGVSDNFEVSTLSTDENSESLIDIILVDTLGDLLVGDSIAVDVVVDDERAVQSVDLYLDQQLIRRENYAPYNWNAPGQNDLALQSLLAGDYVFEAVVIFDNSESATESLNFVVNDIENIPTEECRWVDSSNDFAVVLENSGSTFSIVFEPLEDGIAEEMLIFYQSPDVDSAFPGSVGAPNETLVLNGGVGDTIYTYFTYSLPGGGQNSTYLRKNQFILGDCSI